MSCFDEESFRKKIEVSGGLDLLESLASQKINQNLMIKATDILDR